MATENRNYFSEDDFIEEEGGRKELTVTITLREYRNLVRETERMEAVCNNLNNELKSFKEGYEVLVKVVMKSEEIPPNELLYRIAKEYKNQETEETE